MESKQNEIEYTPVTPFNSVDVRKYYNVEKKAKWPKTTFTEKRVAFHTEETYIPTIRNPLQAENYHVFINFGNLVYRIANVQYASDVYSFIKQKQKDYVKACNAKKGHFSRLFSHEKLPSFSLTYRGYLIRNDRIELSMFNVPNGAHLNINMHLLMGGASENILLPTYSYVQECEKQVLKEFAVQSSDVQATIDYGLLKMRSLFPAGELSTYCAKLFEDIMLLINGIVKSKSKYDYTIALITFVKLRMDGPLFSSKVLSCLTEKFLSLFESFQVQSV
jgi:hypothetical protein